MPETWVERVFERLGAQLGNKVADLWAGMDESVVKREWAEALSGFDPTEIARGLEGSRTRAFAPTLGEFLRLCRPALDPEVAWFEAQAGMREREGGGKGEWTHPAVYRAARDFGYELRTGNFKEHRKRWEWMLQREFRLGWSLGVPEGRLQLGHTPPAARPPTAEERQRLADLRERVQAKRVPFDENAP